MGELMCTAICKQTIGATCIYKAYFKINNSKYTCNHFSNDSAPFASDSSFDIHETPLVFFLET